jgi:hypothetical protein
MSRQNELQCHLGEWHPDWERTKRGREEHVSFTSFVKYFKISDKDEAMAYYDNLLISKSVKKTRRENALFSLPGRRGIVDGHFGKTFKKQQPCCTAPIITTSGSRLYEPVNKHIESNEPVLISVSID